jgi:hypothetical protein
MGKPIMRQKLHTEILSKKQREVLQSTGSLMSSWKGYLCGGTALGLYLGHRRSIDLDWFTPKTIEPHEIHEGMIGLGSPVFTNQNTTGTYLGVINDVKVSIFRYKYPLLRPIQKIEETPIASLEDIAAMKLLAICQRSKKRDYVDIAALIDSHKISLTKMLDAFKRKYPSGDMGSVLRAITYFEDVDKDPMPAMLKPMSWKNVKKTIQKAVNELKF